MENRDLLRFAEEVARGAGEILRRNYGGKQSIHFKGEIDLVTEVDRRSEAYIMGSIRSAFPDHGILSEESSEILTSSPYRWIVDPLDGTTNYAHGYPCFSVSIGVERDGEVIYGVVYDPTLEELFTAEREGGTFLNGKRLRVSAISRLSDALLATGFPPDVATAEESNLDHFANFMKRAQAVRRPGSAALDLCYVAAGRFDGFWELRLSPWDVAAGSLMVLEAGGRVTDLRGQPLRLSKPQIVATNGLLHEEMLRILAKEI